MLARIGRWALGGKAARHLVYLEITTGCATIVGFGNLGKSGVIALGAFQLS
nr:hypothetical protein [Rhizobium lusitanum]